MIRCQINRVVAAAILLCILLPIWSRAQSNSLPLLTTAAQVRQLTPDQAEKHYPVKVRGIITVFDERTPAAVFRFFQDDTAGIYFYPGDLIAGPPLASGQLVEIQGVSDKGEFAPILDLKQCRVIGDGKYPEPRQVTFDQLASGEEDSQFVEFSGIVRSARYDESTRYFMIELATGGGRLTVYATALPGQQPEDLADCTVRVRGVCATHFNQLRQLFDILLVLPRPEDLVIEKPAPKDPFVIQAQKIRNLLQFSLTGTVGHRVKVRGTVVYRPDDRNLYIKDETEGLHVETTQIDPLLVGDEVEVLGFPSKGEYTPILQDAVFHKIGSGSLPKPDEITTDEALKGTHDCRLVRLTATVIDRARQTSEQFLVLQSGGFIFHAYMQKKGAGTDFAYLQNGSTVALTGVCLIEPGNEWHVGRDWRAKSFRVLLRSAGDITLLAQPPWWNLRRMLWAVAFLAAIVMLAFVWVAVLRRRVFEQTRIIRQKLQAEAAIKERYEDLFENANDMVFTHDLAGNLTSMNATGEQLLQRSRGEILGRNFTDFVASEQRAMAGQWLKDVVKGAELPPTEWDLINCSGQRLRVEINTRIVGKAPVHEVEGIGRDVTERNRLEKEILDVSTREQRRIGHDLHDGVCQQLAAIGYRLDVLTDELSHKGIDEAAEAEHIGRLIGEAVGQTRGVARSLFPVRLDTEGLVAALEELASNSQKLFKVKCHLNCPEPPPEMDRGAAIHLYYIAQEAVVNAVKHGHAISVEIALRRSENRFALTVSDDGAGFQPDRVTEPGMGIRIIRYRARLIGATLDLQSQPGRGTQVICVFFPLPKQAEK